jgi:hypothetical protein
MKANGRLEFMIVVSLPRRRANPRTAVNVPRVTINGGNLNPAIRAPLTAPQPRPAANPAGMPIRPQLGSFEAMTATIAAKARIEPTHRSMPEVRITNVMPAARTTLIDACCITIDRFCQDLENASDTETLVTLWGYCGASSLEEAGYVIPEDGKD